VLLLLLLLRRWVLPLLARDEGRGARLRRHDDDLRAVPERGQRALVNELGVRNVAMMLLLVLRRPRAVRRPTNIEVRSSA
jgi:hypothetical protein